MEWLLHCFFKSLYKTVKIQKRKLLLFIDRYPSRHPYFSLTNVKIEYLPGNCKNILRRRPRSFVLSKLITESIFWKKLQHHYDEKAKTKYNVNVSGALYFVKQSWNQVSRKTLKNTFKKRLKWPWTKSCWRWLYVARNHTI